MKALETQPVVDSGDQINLLHVLEILFEQKERGTRAPSRKGIICSLYSYNERKGLSAFCYRIFEVSCAQSNKLTTTYNRAIKRKFCFFCSLVQEINAKKNRYSGEPSNWLVTSKPAGRGKKRQECYVKTLNYPKTFFFYKVRQIIITIRCI